MSFLDLLALRKAKLGGKYQAPEGQRGDPENPPKNIFALSKCSRIVRFCAIVSFSQILVSLFVLVWSGPGFDSTSPQRSNLLGSSCWFSADDLKCEFWPVEIDDIYLGGTKLAEEESVSEKVCLDRKSKYQHEHQKDPGLKSLLCREYFSLCYFGFYLCPLQIVPPFGLPPQKSPHTRRCCWALSPILYGCWWSTDIFPWLPHFHFFTRTADPTFLPSIALWWQAHFWEVVMKDAPDDLHSA